MSLGNITKHFRFNFNVFLTVILLVGVLTLVIAQVLKAASLTQTEATLFNTLQFIFSIALGYVITKSVTFRQFRETQRQFAIAAFRRIKEIERSVERLQRYIHSKRATSISQAEVNLDVIEASLASAQDTVKSSIADWADIIGDEIQLTKEIENLQTLRQSISDASIQGNSNWLSEELKSKLIDVDRQISKLTHNLPASLRETVETDDGSISRCLFTLFNEYKLSRSFVLEAFWEADDTFVSNPSELKVDETVYIAHGMTEHRREMYVAYNDKGESIGVITNKFLPLGKYEHFRETLDLYFGGRVLPTVL